VISFTPPVTLPPGYWMGPRAGLDGCGEEKKSLDSAGIRTPDHPAHIL